MAVAVWRGAGVFVERVKLRVAKGDRVRFWEDVWCEGSPLMDRFPVLFSISSKKGRPVKD